jgi:hypothetical protein
VRFSGRREFLSLQCRKTPSPDDGGDLGEVLTFANHGIGMWSPNVSMAFLPVNRLGVRAAGFGRRRPAWLRLNVPAVEEMLAKFKDLGLLEQVELPLE